MERGERTTVYIRKDMKQLGKEKGLNLSRILTEGIKHRIELGDNPNKDLIKEKEALKARLSAIDMVLGEREKVSEKEEEMKKQETEALDLALARKEVAMLRTEGKSFFTPIDRLMHKHKWTRKIAVKKLGI